MKPEAQRIAIAEACGWEFAPGYPQELAQNKRLGLRWGYINDRGYVPDYLNDLNAMHEAEKVLLNDQRRAYVRTLIEVHPLQYDPTNPGPLCHDGGKMNLFLIASMTAAQRAEAFLRTIGKWVES